MEGDRGGRGNLLCFEYCRKPGADKYNTVTKTIQFVRSYSFPVIMVMEFFSQNDNFLVKIVQVDDFD